MRKTKRREEWPTVLHPNGYNSPQVKRDFWSCCFWLSSYTASMRRSIMRSYMGFLNYNLKFYRKDHRKPVNFLIHFTFTYLKLWRTAPGNIHGYTTYTHRGTKKKLNYTWNCFTLASVVVIIIIIVVVVCIARILSALCVSLFNKRGLLIFCYFTSQNKVMCLCPLLPTGNYNNNIQILVIIFIFAL